VVALALIATVATATFANNSNYPQRNGANHQMSEEQCEKMMQGQAMNHEQCESMMNSSDHNSMMGSSGMSMGGTAT